MDIKFLTPEQVQRALVLNWQATLIANSLGLTIKVPTAIVGGTGCGKTDAVRAFHKTLKAKGGDKQDVKLWTIRMSHILPEDLGGYAAKDDDKKRLVHYMLDCLPFDCADIGVIFCDEFDRASTENQNASMPLVYGDDFHGHAISPNAYVVLALNGASDTYTTPLSKAIRTRVCSLFVSRNAVGSADSYEKWALEHNIPEVVRVFHKWSSNLFEVHEDYEELAICEPRTLDMAGMVSLAKEKIDKIGSFETNDIYPACIAGCIGNAAAAQYLMNDEMLKATNPEDVVNDPINAKIPEYKVLAFLVEAVCQHIKNSNPSKQMQMAKNTMTYTARILNDEWKRMFYDRLADAYPSILTDPDYQRVANRR